MLTPTFHPEAIGTPHYATALARQLRDRGELDVVVTNMPYYPAFERFPGYGRHRRADEVDGIDVRRLPTVVPRAGRPGWRAVSELNMLLQVVVGRMTGRLPAAERVLVISPAVPLAVAAARVLAGRRGHVTAWVHDVAFGLATATSETDRGARSLLGRLVRRLEAWCLSRADAVACLTAQMATVVAALPGVPVPEVVPLWPTVSCPAVADDVGDDRPATLLVSGNLGRKQGIETLVAVARMTAGDDRVRLVVRGTGPGRAALEDAIAAEGVPGVHFADLVPVDELSAALRAGTVHLVTQAPSVAPYVMPSRLLNILAVGRPVVIAADPGAIDDLAAATDAVVRVPAQDAAALVAAALDIVSEPDRGAARGERGRQWVTAHRDVASSVETLLRRRPTGIAP